MKYYSVWTAIEEYDDETDEYSRNDVGGLPFRLARFESLDKAMEWEQMLAFVITQNPEGLP